MNAKKQVILSNLMTIAPILISVVALGVSVTETVRGHNFRQTSLTPLVSLSSGIGEDLNLYLEVNNSGLGPAKIKWYQIYLDGELMSSPMKLAEGLRDEIASNKLVFRLLNQEASIPSNATIRTFDVQIRESDFAILDRLQQVICYCSIFGSCEAVSDRMMYDHLGSKKIISKQGKITMPTCSPDVVHRQNFGMPE